MFKSLRWRVIIVFIGLSIGPILLISVIIGRYSFTILEQGNLKLQKEIASGVASDIKGFIDARQSELAVLADFGELNRRSLKEQRELLSNFLFYRDNYQELVLLDMQGHEQIRLSRTSVFLAEDLQDRASSQEYLIPLLTSEIYFGDVYFDDKVRAPLLTISIPLFELQSGRVTCILLAKLRFNTVWGFLAVDDLSGEDVYVVDQDGRVVGHRNPGLVLAGRTLDSWGDEGRVIGLSGVDVVRAQAMLPLSRQKLHVIAEQPLSVARTLVRKVTDTVALVSCSALVLAAFMIFLVSRRLIRPIEELAASAKLISAGNYPEPIEVASRDEVGQLADSFNHMSASLQESQLLSQSYTKELQRKNEQLSESFAQLERLNLKLSEEVAGRRKTQQALQAEHDRFVSIMDSLDALVYAADIENHEIVFANRRIHELFGEAKENVCWKRFPEGQEVSCGYCRRQKLFDDENQPLPEPSVWEFEDRRNNRWYQCRDQAIPWSDGRIVLLEIATDITSLKRTEERLVTSLKEKEVMLREIHHRVKNNMQVILSLLRMYSQRSASNQVSEVFADCRSRILAMSLVHEALYMSENLTRIDFKTYLQKICSNLSQVYRGSRQGISLMVDGHDVSLTMDQGIAVGMVISELVSNAFKHAFTSERPGRVLVGLSGQEHNSVELVVADDGRGLPPEVDLKHPSSLGLQLVTATVERELDGSIDVDCNGGTRFTIKFISKE